MENPRYTTLIPAWIRKYVYCKVWYEITYTYLHFYSAAVEVGNGQSISSHSLLGMWLHIHAGIKVNPNLYKEPKIV